MMKSYIHAGFECSAHFENGKRLNLQESTGHLKYCHKDYKAITDLGINVAREGLLWNVVDKSGEYDFSPYLPLIQAANEFDVEVIWDFCHYGFPDDISVDSPDFVERFKNYSIEAYKFLSDNLKSDIHICLFNEPSFLAKNLESGHSFDSSKPTSSISNADIKPKLCKAIIEATKALKQIGSATYYFIDPLVHIAYVDEESRERVRQMREYQFEALNFVLGRDKSELGGREDLVNVIGINHYPYSNWLDNNEGKALPMDNPFYHNLSKQLFEVRRRYSQPIYISETGVEGDARPEWIKYIISEAALFGDILGICIYPITDYPGWTNDRYCPCGLFSYPDNEGNRAIYEPLKNSLAQVLFSPDKVGIISL